MSNYPELKDYKTLQIPLAVIYFDSEFNCRGEFTPQSCLELAESMKSKGLKIPVIVQPQEDVPALDDPYEFRIVAGHRRYTAAKYLLRWDTIAATVVSGMSEEVARVLNLVENLERKNLTFYQEAVALRKNYPAGTPYEKMARDLNKSGSWCRFRWKMLDLPEAIIQLVKQGVVKHDALVPLLYKTEKEQLAIAADLEAAHVQGTSPKRKPGEKLKGRSRSRRDIDTMLTELMAEGLYPDSYRALMWAAGRLTDEELLVDPD